MSWMVKLYETYEQGIQQNLPDEQKPMPISHTLQNAHINIIIDDNGNFRKARVLEKTQIVLPSTEKSAGRSSGEAPHPLADKLQYVAADYGKFGGKKKSYFEGYRTKLKSWCQSEYCHPKARAVLRYLEKQNTIQDLINAKVCYLDDSNHLLTTWPLEVSEEHPLPALFKALPKEGGKFEQGNALVCWTVETEGDPISNTWEDESLQQSWIDFDTQTLERSSLCYVLGKNLPMATNHPAKLRHTGDKAKLVSSNDTSGFTFRGRFVDGEHAASIGFEVTQKAHNALRWLISRQGIRNGDQVVVAWAVSCKPIPEPMAETLAFDLDDLSEIELTAKPPVLETETDLSTDFGQRFAYALKSYIAGYQAKLIPTETIVIMSLDSATPGRMAITYYRDYMAKDYLRTIEQWHLQFSWYQRVSKEIKREGKRPKAAVRWLISAPSPWNILQATYGDIIKSNESLKKNLYERLLPCIVEGKTFPIDLVNLAVNRASNRNNCEYWEWERNLGVACALFRGFCNRHPKLEERRNYTMSLDTQSRSRDYLYGRLLAVAERIEEIAMVVASEPSRSTHASRLMQRFADRPSSTWLNIRNSLAPYQQRLKAKRPPLEAAYNRLLDDICDAFSTEDFISEARLSGEYLLGFHCQRKWLRDHKLEQGQWVLKTTDETELTNQEGNEE